MDDSRAETARELAALRKLDLIDPVHVTRWATEQFRYEPSSPALVALASLPDSRSTRAAEIDRLLVDFLSELGEPPLTLRGAGLTVAKRIAREIVDGIIEPGLGARKIWWDVYERVPELEERLRGFVGLASEWEDSPKHRAEYEDDIVDEARELLDEPGEP